MAAATVTRYEEVKDWPSLPPDVQLGETAGVAVDANGHVLIFHRPGRGFDLTAATGSLAFSVPVLNTTPKLYVCLGEPEQIRNLLSEWTANEVAEAPKRARAVRLVYDRNSPTA